MRRQFPLGIHNLQTTVSASGHKYKHDIFKKIILVKYMITQQEQATYFLIKAVLNSELKLLP